MNGTDRYPRQASGSNGSLASEYADADLSQPAFYRLPSGERRLVAADSIVDHVNHGQF